MSRVRFRIPKRIPPALQPLRGRAPVPRPGETIVDHAPAGERIEIERVLAKNGASWRILDSRGRIISIEATATGGVWASCQPPGMPIETA